MSSNSDGRASISIGMRVEVRDPCPVHVDKAKVANGSYWKTRVARTGRFPFFTIKRVFELPECDCPKPLVGAYETSHDLGTTNLTNIMLMNIFNSATLGSALYDTSGGTHTGSANTATSNLIVGVGDDLTPVAPADYQIPTTYAWGTTACTVSNTVTVAGVTSYFTATGTLPNGSSNNQIAGNCGIILTCGGNTYLISHDNINMVGGVPTGYVVSPAGTVQVLYYVTVS